MSFTNEYVSKEYWFAYDLEHQDRLGRCITMALSSSWKIDRERNIYVRKVGSNHRDITLVRAHWDFFWKGVLIEMDTVQVSICSTGGRAGHLEIVNRLEALRIPSEKEVSLLEVMEDFKRALEVRRGGMRSEKSSFKHTLELSRDIENILLG